MPLISNNYIPCLLDCDYVCSKLPMPKTKMSTSQQLPRMRELPQRKNPRPLLCKVKAMKPVNLDAQRRRQNVQNYFWCIVGSAEHINIPKLKDALKKEFCTSDSRFIEAQIRFMRTEGRIKVQNNVKVWIRQPPA